MKKIEEAKEVYEVEAEEVKDDTSQQEQARLQREVEKANLVIHFLKSRVGTLEAEKAILMAESELNSRQ